MLTLTPIQRQIMKGKVCPYCKQRTEYVDSAVIYSGNSYGMIYYCKPCDAYCGVHKGTDKALGRLANKELRHWKKEAHKHFDLLWKDGHMTRKEAYRRLGNYLLIPEQYCHIGMFSVFTCQAVVNWSRVLLYALTHNKPPEGIKNVSEAGQALAEVIKNLKDKK